jgi:hypothetical protein
MALYEREESAWQPGRFTPRNIAPVSEGILDGSSVGTVEVAKGKFVTPEKNRKPIIRPVGWSLYRGAKPAFYWLLLLLLLLWKVPSQKLRIFTDAEYRKPVTSSDRQP